MLVCSLLIAMALNQRVFIRRWLRTAYVLPLVASFVLVWQTLFDWNGAKKYEGGLYSMPIGVSLSMMQANKQCSRTPR